MIPSTLTSSSRSGQCIPSPPAISRQLFLSRELPCSSRGYHINGTETVRPSERSTANESSVVATLWAFTVCILRLKELIPTPQQNIYVLVNQFANAIQLTPAKTLIILQSHGIEPKLRLIFIPFDMDMRRFL